MPTDGIPSRRELTAAYWTGRVLTAEGLRADDRHASYRTLPIGGRVDFADLDAAEGLLQHAGLAHHDVDLDRLMPSSTLQRICALHEPVALEPLLAAILEHETPLWLLAATGGNELRGDLVPDGAGHVLDDLFLDADRREAFLLARGRKVEADQRAAIGALGERAVVAAATTDLVALGQPDLAAQVRQVSTVSDELGYDVTAPRIDGSTRRLEVKTTQAATTTVSVFLSRNEASVGLADPDWHLVVCALQEGTDVAILGWVCARDIADRFPSNTHQDGAWESARIRIPTTSLTTGLPPA